MKRVLFAINNKSAEQKLSKLIKENGKDEQYQVVGTLVSNESITDFLSNKSTDILVYIEGLNGKEDGFDYILRLHRTHPHIRIVFIAGQRNIGDKKLATLVAFHIYDIIAGQRILMSDVAERIVNPAEFEDVMMYLPDGADLFRDSDFQPRNANIQVAQDESERIAEKAGLLKQIADAENLNKSLSIRLSASETQIRELENEKATWKEEASRERMVLEKTFDAEKKSLSATIIELSEKLENLTADKEAAQKSYDELKEKYDSMAKSVSQQQTQNSTVLKTVQNDLRTARVQLEEKTRECAAIRTELDNLKKSLAKERDAIIAEAQARAKALLEEVNVKAQETEKLAAELKQKLALYGDQGFEAYKAQEEAKLEEQRKNLQNELNAERERHQQALSREHEMAQVEKAKRLNELDLLIESKSKEAALIDERIQAGEEEVRKAKQDEIHRMDAVLEGQKATKQAELDKLDADISGRKESVQQLDSTIASKRTEIVSIDDDLAEARKKKEEELKALEDEYATKALEAKNVTFEKEERAIEEHKKKTEQEMLDITKAFADEKRRLAKDFEAYKKELIDKRAEADAEFGVAYTFNEKDFTSGPSVNSRCTPVIFYSPVPGTGNSTLALNIATFIAMNNRKTIYVELNHQHPTLKDQLGVSLMKDSLDYAFDGLRQGSYDLIDQNIITKQKILNLKTSASDMQARYPDMLSYLTYTEDRKNKHAITIDFIKGLIAYLKYKKHYEYIILDIPSYFDKKLVNDIYTICTKYIVSVNQDILSMNNLINMRDYIQNLTALEKTFYVVNKYAENTVLSNRKISEICKIQVPLIVPSECNDAMLAAYKSVPILLITKSKPLASAYKMIAEHIMR